MTPNSKPSRSRTENYILKYGKYSNMSDVLKQGCPLNTMDFNLLYPKEYVRPCTMRTGHSTKNLKYIFLVFGLRSSDEPNLVPTCSGIFQDCATRLFNSLPGEMPNRNSADASIFIRKCKCHLLSAPNATLDE